MKKQKVLVKCFRDMRFIQNLEETRRGNYVCKSLVQGIEERRLIRDCKLYQKQGGRYLVKDDEFSTILLL